MEAIISNLMKCNRWMGGVGVGSLIKVIYSKGCKVAHVNLNCLTKPEILMGMIQWRLNFPNPSRHGPNSITRGPAAFMHDNQLHMLKDRLYCVKMGYKPFK